MKSAMTSAPALHLGTMILFLQKRSNQSMKPTVLLREKFSTFATTPCRGFAKAIEVVKEDIEKSFRWL
jgi:hypothetical protein